MQFTDADEAAVYDQLNPWDEAAWPADAYYTRLVMDAGDVLDVGCGTGSLLAYVREKGHRGRLAGIEPDAAMLARARAKRDDVEWVLGRAEDVSWHEEFDLAVMTSHAFQCLVADAELAASLRAVRGALRPGGRFAFETRHPAARAWEQWTAAQPEEVVLDGRSLLVATAVDRVDGDVVALSETTSAPDGTVLHRGAAELRFLDVPDLNARLAAAGFAVERQYGDWRHGPVTPASREIVTVAVRG